MADKLITDLTALGEAPAVGDLLPLEDISVSTTKKLTIAYLFTSPSFTTPTIGVATGSSLTLDQAVTSGLVVSGATTQAVNITGNATTGIKLQTGSFTTGINLGGTLTTGITVGACTTAYTIGGNVTTGYNIGANATDAFKVSSGTVTNGFNVAGGTITTGFNCSGAATTGLSIGGATTTGISIAGATTNAISIPVTAASTCAILIGASVSSGMPLTSTKNGLVRAFGEIQATEALSNDIRGGWFRVRQNGNCDVTGGYSTVGLQGSFKMYGHASSTTTTLWNASGVYGTFETDGVASSNVASGGLIAGVYGQLGLLANFTIDSGAIAAAVAAMSNSNSSMTATGSFAGVYVGRAIGSSAKAFTTGVQIEASSCATGLSIGTATTGISLSGNFTDGIVVGVGTFTTSALRCGNFASSYATGSAIPFSSDLTGVAKIYGESTSDLTSAKNCRTIVGRHLVVTSSATINHESYGIIGQLCVKNTSLGHYHGGVMGTYESNTAATVLTSYGVGASIARLGAESTTVNSGGLLAGFLAVENTASWTNNGTIAAFATKVASGKTAWPIGLYIGASDCTTGISIGSCTTGVLVSGTGAAATSKAVSTSGWTINNANLTDGYGIMEADLTLTGTVAGASAALSAWVNMASVTTGSNLICAQTNGLWSDTGGILTNGKFVFGMRADCLLQTNGGAVGATFYPFSIVNNTNITTALIDCNAASSDLGEVTNAGSDLGTLVPLFKDGAKTGYVKIYALA